FMPETGRVLLLKFPTGDGIRFDSGLYEGQDITTSFDPMLAKLVVHAPTRTLAIEAMIKALQQLVLLGITTNIEYLQRVLHHPLFVAGDFDTGFIKQQAETLQPATPATTDLHAALIAGYLADRSTRIYRDVTPAPYAAIGRWRN